jgi:hypothetical protein
MRLVAAASSPYRTPVPVERDVVEIVDALAAALGRLAARRQAADDADAVLGVRWEPRGLRPANALDGPDADQPARSFTLPRRLPVAALAAAIACAAFGLLAIFALVLFR